MAPSASASRLRARHANTQITLAFSPDAENLGEQINITLYRMVQECLNNVARHAQAANVTIALERGAEGVRLSVFDDGDGAAQWHTVSGLGLVGMRERVESLGGTVDIASTAGHGFRVSARIPVEGAP